MLNILVRNVQIITYDYYEHSISVLGRDEGYTVKYNHLPEGVPETKPKGTPEGN